MIPSERGPSEPRSATAMAIVSLWTSRPTNVWGSLEREDPLFLFTAGSFRV
jgi:hypothetical protein